ncbi:cGMP-dependent 3',5'-cyclic phosphodiesterase [Trichonephila clavipes]|nr:cGMP-dependent 3',5'-cyclic phosphodiesterase [Trichonephila clavipes]
MKKCRAEEALIFFVAEDHSELLCEVVGNKILSEEIKVSVENSTFQTVLEKKTSQIVNKAKFCLGNNNSFSIQVDSILCVPLFNSNAEDRVASLLCLVNKKKQINLEVARDDIQELLDSYIQEMTVDELTEMNEQEQGIEELFRPSSIRWIGNVGNLIEGLSLI